MDAPYRQHNARSLRGAQRQSIDQNSAIFLESLVQQDIGQAQALSPGQADSHGSTSAHSPTPPAAPHHQQTNPQPFATGLQPGYFSSNPIGMPRSTTSPISQYGQPVSAALETNFNNFGFDMNFSDMSAQGDNGMIGMRANATE